MNNNIELGLAFHSGKETYFMPYQLSVLEKRGKIASVMDYVNANFV